MEKKLTNCNPSVCNRKDLTTGEFEFLTKEDIKQRCNCINKAVCLQIADLLKNGHWPEAEELIKQI